jgi:hypothetical protein
MRIKIDAKHIVMWTHDPDGVFDAFLYPGDKKRAAEYTLTDCHSRTKRTRPTARAMSNLADRSRPLDRRSLDKGRSLLSQAGAHVSLSHQRLTGSERLVIVAVCAAVRSLASKKSSPVISPACRWTRASRPLLPSKRRTVVIAATIELWRRSPCQVAIDGWTA